MRRRGNRKEPKGEFGREVTKVLRARDVNNLDLFEALRDGGVKVSESYLNYIIAGRRHASPDLIDPICLVLGAEGAARVRLHLAAAMDWGYDLQSLFDA